MQKQRQSAGIQSSRTASPLLSENLALLGIKGKKDLEVEALSGTFRDTFIY
jgi:hypothetical protein